MAFALMELASAMRVMKAKIVHQLLGWKMDAQNLVSRNVSSFVRKCTKQKDLLLQNNATHHAITSVWAIASLLIKTHA